MGPEQVLGVIEKYRREFEARRISKRSYPHGELLSGEVRGLEHCHAMLDKMVGFVQEGKTEKAMRWLGFVQGAFWMAGIYPIDDFKADNRSVGS